MVKIVSWNVNSIKSRLTLLISCLEEYRPDIVLLQELKCTNEAFPYREIEDLGYNIAIHGQKTYNGVAILSKFALEDVCTILPDNPDKEQSRYIEAIVTLPDKRVMRVCSVYVPNGQEVGSEKFLYKLKFLHSLKDHLAELLTYKELLIVGGDFNIAPENIDVYDANGLKNTICFNIEEQKLFRSITNLGLIDIFRALYPDKQEFTWWDYRAGSWQHNKGMRIDHFIVSPELADLVKAIKIDLTLRAKVKPSDHAAILCELAL